MHPYKRYGMAPVRGMLMGDTPMGWPLRSAPMRDASMRWPSRHERHAYGMEPQMISLLVYLMGRISHNVYISGMCITCISYRRASFIGVRLLQAYISSRRASLIGMDLLQAYISYRRASYSRVLP